MIKEFLYIWIHHKGWCEKLHRSDKYIAEGLGGKCPLIDWVMLKIYPIKFIEEIKDKNKNG